LEIVVSVPEPVVEPAAVVVAGVVVGEAAVPAADTAVEAADTAVEAAVVDSSSNTFLNLVRSRPVAKEPLKALCIFYCSRPSSKSPWKIFNDFVNTIRNKNDGLWGLRSGFFSKSDDNVHGPSYNDKNNHNQY
jgi:hypothetical protein